MDAPSSSLLRIPYLSHLSNRQIIDALHRAAGRERGATAELVAVLAEFDSRRLYLVEGCSSLFTYCTQVLHLSEHAAYLRIEAARTARRFPKVVEMIADGDITLTAVAALGPHLTQANHLAVLRAVRHKSKREIAHQVACLAPRPAPATLVRRLPAPRSDKAAGHDARSAAGPGASGAAGRDARGVVGPDARGVAGRSLNSALTRDVRNPASRDVPNAARDAAGADAGHSADAAAGHSENHDARPGADAVAAADIDATADASPGAGERPIRRVTPPTRMRATIEARSADSYLLRVSLPASTHATLRRAQDLLRHSIPNGDPAAILDRALTLLVRALERQKVGRADRPRPMRSAVPTVENTTPTHTTSAPNPRSRYIPAAVRREVWRRDEGRCAFIGRNGRCTETGFLEFHHIVPFASEGPSTAANIALRCRAHNAFESGGLFQR
jgi:5-methylcytosine-specific restriction endonuclease McrA